MVRLWFGQELCFAHCCLSSTPLSLSSSSTVRRWRCRFAQWRQFFSNLFSVPKLALCLHHNFLPQITLFYNCRPAMKTFRSTTSTFFFLMVLLFGWGLATAVMVYSFSEWAPLLSNDYYSRAFFSDVALHCWHHLSTQNHSIKRMWSFPFFPLHVGDCSIHFLQPLYNYTGVSVLHRFPSILHPFVFVIWVSGLSESLLYIYSIYYVYSSTFDSVVLWFSTVCFMLYNHRSSLLFSVMLCYFIALAAVYGKSVALLRAQLKLVCLFSYI